jgi:hypothetical protein
MLPPPKPSPPAAVRPGDGGVMVAGAPLSQHDRDVAVAELERITPWTP